ncbi:hypothetical protein [Clostridioides difficile]
MPEDEAGYIAIHIINGLENSQKMKVLIY